MSDILQPGLQMDQTHPDADQLTAFAEHALPPHEQQQTLAHLAACSDCRQIVFLAQQAVEAEAIEPEPAKVRKPWFSGWNLVWPAMLAVAGIVAFSLYLRNFSRPAIPTDAVTMTQLERQNPPVPPAPPAAEEQRTETASPTVAPKKKDGAPPVASSVTRTAEAKATAQIVMEQKPLANLSQASTIHGAIGGASAAPVSLGSPAPAPLAFGASTRQRLGGIKSGPAAQQVQSNEFAAKDQLAQDQAATGAVTFADKAQLSMASPAPPPPAVPQAAPIAAANETVTVDATSVAELSTMTSESLAMVAPGRVLPSHLPSESTASLGAVTLALDSQGKLFRSKDQGRRWKGVKPFWDGRAATIGTAEPAPTAIFVLTNEAGDVWTSSDGQHWKRK